MTRSSRKIDKTSVIAGIIIILIGLNGFMPVQGFDQLYNSKRAWEGGSFSILGLGFLIAGLRGKPAFQKLIAAVDLKDRRHAKASTIALYGILLVVVIGTLLIFYFNGDVQETFFYFLKNPEAILEGRIYTKH